LGTDNIAYTPRKSKIEYNTQSDQFLGRLLGDLFNILPLANTSSDLVFCLVMTYPNFHQIIVLACLRHAGAIMSIFPKFTTEFIGTAAEL
jgi:hypothetical protein